MSVPAGALPQPLSALLRLPSLFSLRMTLQSGESKSTPQCNGNHSCRLSVRPATDCKQFRKPQNCFPDIVFGLRTLMHAHSLL